MKITITGVNGFVGQNLCTYLLANSYDVNCVSVRNSHWKNEIDRETIIHLAGKAHDTKNTSQESEYFEVNSVLTQELFDVFLESDSKCFIYFSSVKAVADEVFGVLYEDEIENPKTPYGQSKLQAEQYILSKKLPTGKRVFIIRPCMIHGPGNKGNLNLLFNVINKGIPYPLKAFNNERSFLGIDNLNFLIKQILENQNIPSGVYNFADDEYLSTNELVQIISSVLNKKNSSFAVPKKIITSLARLGDILKLPLNSEKIQKLTENYKVSNQKIKSVIGIEKLPYTSKEGLNKTIASFKAK